MSLVPDRPQVTFVLLAYNQQPYIEEALRGALSQTYSPLEIIVSDDCSSDGTFEVASRIVGEYAGPHRVILRRNDKNLGFMRHLTSLMKVASGELIVAAAGDDISREDRVERIVETWNAHGRPRGSIFSRYRTIGDGGEAVRSHDSTHPPLTFRLRDRPRDVLDSVCVGTLGCSHAWTRDVFDIFGDIDPRAIHEDVTIPLRSLLLGSLIFIPDELVCYRLTPGSLSRVAFDDHRERMRKMARYWAGRVANYEQFRRDAQLALDLGLSDAASVQWALEAVEQKLDFANRNVRFFNGGTWLRLKLAMGSWGKVPFTQMCKWLVIALLPWSYALKRR